MMWFSGAGGNWWALDSRHGTRPAPAALWRTTAYTVPARRPDEAGRCYLVFIGPGRLGYAWGPIGAMLAGLVT
jgi:hypothetical protein